jgi:Glycosyl hydrolase family 99
VALSLTTLPRVVWAADVAGEILAFYYGWYGNPQVTGQWHHWKNVDPVNKRAENVTDYPAYGAYDSHDPAVVERQAEAARAAGITSTCSQS